MRRCEPKFSVFFSSVIISIFTKIIKLFKIEIEKLISNFSWPNYLNIIKRFVVKFKLWPNDYEDELILNRRICKLEFLSHLNSCTQSTTLNSPEIITN